MLTHDYKPTLRSHTHWQATQCNRTDQSLPKSMPAQPHGGQESTGYNSVLPQLAVTCKIEAECSYQTFVQVDSVVLRNPPLRQAPNRQAVKKISFS